jgi:hypothetical protein
LEDFQIPCIFPTDSRNPVWRVSRFPDSRNPVWRVSGFPAYSLLIPEILFGGFPDPLHIP